jgi:limonene-1,2-epoxide hydrolase
MTVPNTEPNTAPSAAAGVSATTTAGSVATVKAFLDALGRLDTDGALALLADDVVYQNVSLPKANGKAAVAKQLGLFGRYCKGFEAINHRIVGDGDTVLTERTDIIEIGRVRSEFWVCGTFEVRDGKIVLWRDYFDWANIIAGTAKGAGRALVGLAKSLRR